MGGWGGSSELPHHPLQVFQLLCDSCDQFPAFNPLVVNIHSGFCLLGWTLTTNIPVQVSDLTGGGKAIGVYAGGGIVLLFVFFC